jgi:hypothetical protein
MPDIARLDDNGLLIAVDTVADADWRTDPQARTVKLPANHDMRERIGTYRYEFLRQRFMPVSREPLDVADRDGPELVDALVFTVWELVRQDVVTVPPKVRQALQAWRQTLDGRRQRG